MVEGTLPSVAVPVSERVRPNLRVIGLLALGHMVIDINQGSIPAILPFLRAAHNLSYEAVGTIVLAANLTSSIIQPLFGYLSDRSARRWLLPAGVFVSGGALGLLGVVPAYGLLLPLIVLMGLGVAAYHPEGYKTATSVAGDRKATALSWFSLGGNIGIALGPPLMTVLVTGLGMNGTLGIIVPSVFMAALLVAALPRLQGGPVGRAPALAVVDRRRSMPGAMGLLILVVAIRSWTSLGFTTFVPLYYVDYLKSDPRLVGLLLFIFLGAGALGTVIAGPIADRVGTRSFIAWVFVLTAPLAILFLLSAGTVLAFVLLGLVGAALVSSFSVAVVLGQAYLPRHAGTASGLIVGFAIGAGGLGVWFLGVVADRYGLPAALWISAAMPVAGGVVAMFLPAPRDQS